MTRRKTNLFTLDFDLKGVTDVVRLSDGSVAFVRKRPKPTNTATAANTASATTQTVPMPSKETEMKEAEVGMLDLPFDLVEDQDASANEENSATIKAVWTSDDDDKLITMKTDNKTWAQIEEALDGKGKDRGELKARYRELLAEGKAQITAQHPAESSSKAEKKAMKGILKSTKTNTLKETKVSGTMINGELTEIDGHPIIWMDPNDRLNEEHIAFLFAQGVKYEARKWLWLTSRLFDKTGIRMTEDEIRQKFINVRFSEEDDY